MANKKPRPDGWGKALVLERAKDPHTHMPSFVGDMAATAEVTHDTLRGDIKAWRVRDPDFREAYDLAMRKKGEVPPRGPARMEESDPEALDRFLEAYVASGGDVEKAADIAGYSWPTIYRRTKQGDIYYDEAFAAAYAEAKCMVMGSLESQVMRDVREAPDHRTRLWGALQVLERRDRERWGRNLDVRHSGRVDHQHSVSKKQLLAEFTKEMQTRFGSDSRPLTVRAELAPAVEET